MKLEILYFPHPIIDKEAKTHSGLSELPQRIFGALLAKT
jgi:hypothetical protein